MARVAAGSFNPTTRGGTHTFHMPYLQSLKVAFGSTASRLIFSDSRGGTPQTSGSAELDHFIRFLTTKLRKSLLPWLAAVSHFSLGDPSQSELS